MNMPPSTAGAFAEGPCWRFLIRMSIFAPISSGVNSNKTETSGISRKSSYMPFRTSPMRVILSFITPYYIRGRKCFTPHRTCAMFHERSRAGVKSALRRGVKFGRKPKSSAEQIDHARKLIDEGESGQYVADLFSAGRATLNRALKR